VKIKRSILEHTREKWHQFDEIEVMMDEVSNTKKREIKGTHNFNLKTCREETTGET